MCDHVYLTRCHFLQLLGSCALFLFCGSAPPLPLSILPFSPVPSSSRNPLSCAPLICILFLAILRPAAVVSCCWQLPGQGYSRTLGKWWQVVTKYCEAKSGRYISPMVSHTTRQLPSAEQAEAEHTRLEQTRTVSQCELCAECLQRRQHKARRPRPPLLERRVLYRTRMGGNEGGATELSSVAVIILTACSCACLAD